MNPDFTIGHWLVRPQRNTLERDGSLVHLAPKAMAVLVCLAQARGEVVERETLFSRVWPGCAVTDDALTQRIVEIRKAFGDSARLPRVIETIPRVGFRLIPPVSPLSGGQHATQHLDPPRGRAHFAGPVRAAAAVAVALLLVGAWWLYDGVGMRAHSPASPGPGGQAATVLAVPERTIAVLPFVNHSPEASDAYLADAIHEEVLTRLARIASLNVISLTSVSKFRDSQLPLPEIARELSVTAVLTGSVQKVGNRLRVRTRLVDAGTDQHLWGQSFDRELTARGVFEIQSDIADNVARSLLISLSPGESERIAAVPTEDFAAYQALLSGHLALEDGQPGSIDQAMSFYQQALQSSPRFAGAYVAMAKAHYMAAERQGMPDTQALAKVEKYARAALELDPGSGLAYNYLGAVSRERGQLHEAEHLFSEALALEPGDPRILHGMGLTLRMLGRPAEAVPYYDRAVRVDPLSPGINESRGSLLRDLGRFAEAEQQYHNTLAIDPDFVNTYWGLGTLYWCMGNPQQAVPWLEKGMALAPRSDVYRTWLALMHLELEQDEQARAVLEGAPGLDSARGDDDAALAGELYGIYQGQDLPDRPDWRRFLYRYWYGGLLDLPPRALLQGQDEAAIRYYEESYPGIATAGAGVDAANYRAAIYVALALQRLGRAAQAQDLLERAGQAIAGLRRLGLHGYWIADVQILALRGDQAAALARLQSAVDEGWRNLWRYYLLHDPALASLRSAPGFGALVEDLRQQARQKSAQLLAHAHRAEVD